MAKETKPAADECKSAANIAEQLAAYTKETEPYAKNDIRALEDAAIVLYAASAFEQEVIK